MTDYRRDAFAAGFSEAWGGRPQSEAGRLVYDQSLAIAWERFLVSSPPDPKGPADEEVERMTRFFIEAWRTTRAGNDHNERWRDVAREAWRLGARMKEK